MGFDMDRDTVTLTPPATRERVYINGWVEIIKDKHARVRLHPIDGATIQTARELAVINFINNWGKE